jgi:PH (Pleckstrin Homology) domain-containing protein
MSGLDRHLAADEAVVYRARTHPATLGWTVVSALCVLGVVALIVARNDLAPSTVAILWLAGVACALGTSLLPWLRWRAAEVVVTPRRVLARLGLRTVYAVDLAGLERVDVDAAPWARVLGYGTLRLTARDGVSDAFAGVRDVQAVRDVVVREARAAGARVRR